MKNNQLKFIYFDVGGVAILDFYKTDKWERMLDSLAIPEASREAFADLFDQHESQLCIGEDIQIFLEEARRLPGVSIPANYDMIADFVERFERNEPILQLLDELKDNYRLGLLTGQYNGMLSLIFKKGLLAAEIWDVIVDSSVEKVAKPDPRIYELAEERAGVAPEEILFIDNKAKLLENPSQRGWKTFEYDPLDTLTSTEKLRRYIASL